MKKTKKNKGLILSIVGLIMIGIFYSISLGIASHKVIELKRQKQLLEKSVWDLNRKNNRLVEANKELAFLRFKEFIIKNRYGEFNQIMDTVYKQGQIYGFSPYLIMSIIKTESNYNKFGKSFCAYGLMQINYNVWKDKLNIDLARIFDIEYNVELGCKILRHYMDLDGDILKALFHYNNGFLFNNMKYVPKITRALIYK